MLNWGERLADQFSSFVPFHRQFNGPEWSIHPTCDPCRISTVSVLRSSPASSERQILVLQIVEVMLGGGGSLGGEKQSNLPASRKLLIEKQSSPQTPVCWRLHQFHFSFFLWMSGLAPLTFVLNPFLCFLIKLWWWWFSKQASLTNTNTNEVLSVYRYVMIRVRRILFPLAVSALLQGSFMALLSCSRAVVWNVTLDASAGN